MRLLLDDFRCRHDAALQVAAALDQIGKGSAAHEFAHALEAAFDDAVTPFAAAYAEGAPAN
ncbi:MAG TPA: hypothetical protein VE996_04505 [Terriglobales bacterium]|nr:hypothetical protein [Terriglobales bacterium]